MKYQGLFRPKSPEKYRGDPTRIVYRSGWELRFMNFLDTHPDVLEWSSEELIIPYRCPLTNKVRRYYPDFVLTQRNKDGEIERKIVEIKPLKETSPPQKPKTKSQSKRYLTEAATFAKNQAKWEAAIDYCRRNKYTFQIITEKELGITNGVRPLPRIR